MTTLDRQQDTLPTAEERFERIPIEQIVASATNPRTHFAPAYIDDLAQSIGEKGVVQPIVVRQMVGTKSQPTRFEIVAGECRWRGAAQALQKTMPAIIRSYTDEQVLEIQLIENIHRKDLTPLEQAVGYRRLIDTNPDKHSAATIATRIGMSLDWVWDRLKLNDLIDEAKALLEQERIGVGHAILIARQKPEDQKTIIDPNERALFQDEDAELVFEAGQKRGKYDEVKPRSIRELESWINDHIRFDVAHAAKAQPLVFEETAAVIETAAAAPGRGKKLVSITHDHAVADDAKDPDERTYGYQSWKRADGKQKSKTCEYSVLGVVAAGEGRGQTLLVCVNREKCKVHFKESVVAREKSAAQRAKGKPTQAARTDQKAAEKEQARRAAEQAARDAWDKLQPLLEAAAYQQLARLKTLTPAMAKEIMESDALEFDSAAAIKKNLGVGWHKSPAAALAISALASTYNLSTYDQFTQVVKRLGVDLKPLQAIRDKHAPAAAEKNGKKKSKAA